MDIKICSVENKAGNTDSFSNTYRQNKKKRLHRDTEKQINKSWKSGVKEEQLLVTRADKEVQSSPCSRAQHVRPK